jgi:hypothetical protein
MKDIQKSLQAGSLQEVVKASVYELLAFQTKAAAICDAIPTDKQHEDNYGLWFEAWKVFSQIRMPEFSLLNDGDLIREVAWHEYVPTNSLTATPDSIKLDNILMRLLSAARNLREVCNPKADMLATEIEYIIRVCMPIYLPGPK